MFRKQTARDNMEDITIRIKHFNDLTNLELYEILRARQAVFVVEQQCPYQDIDGYDIDSEHVFIQRRDGSVAACLRLYMKKDEQGTVQLGRVVTTERGCGLGGKILHAGVMRAREYQNAEGIYLEAQQYAIGYYQKEDFKVVSEPFLEDGIPHVQMRLHFQKENAECDLGEENYGEKEKKQ